MTNPNTDPIYSKVGAISWSSLITAAAGEYTGSDNRNTVVFESNEDNGGYIQRLRFKAASASNNVASVARIYINNGLSNQSVISAPGTPTAVAHTGLTGGVAHSATYYGKVVSVGEGGDLGAVSAEGSVAVTGPTGSATWTIVTPSTTHRIACSRLYVGFATGVQNEYFNIPKSSITASQSGTTLTVTAVGICPDPRISNALVPGSVFATGIAAGTYIANQILPLTAGEEMGGIGRYTLSASATVGSTTCTTDPVKYEQIISPHQMSVVVDGVAQPCSHDGQPNEQNQVLYTEVSLPATTAIATAATPDVDAILNLALPPGYEIYVGLGTAVAGGWIVTAIAGAY